MKPSSYAPALFLALGGATIFLAPGCQDDATIDQEPILPGVGPIGMGGFVSTGGNGGSSGTAGSAGTAGTAGKAGTGGTAAGNGGTTAGTAGNGGAGGTTGGASGSGGMSGTAGMSGAAGMGGGAGGTSGAMCPSGSGATVDLANLVPADGSLDFCVNDGTSTTGPLFSCVGGAATGLTFKQVTAPINLAPGTYTVNAVPNGDCTATPIATGSITLNAGDAMLVAAFGNQAGETAAVKGFLNDPTPTDGTAALRFVHAINGAGALDLGPADSPSLPANVSTPEFSAVAFGSVSGVNTSAPFPVDAQGYATGISADTMIPVAAAPAGTMPAIFAANVTIAASGSAASQSAIGVGISGDATFPIGAIYCDEGTTDSSNALLMNCAPL